MSGVIGDLAPSLTNLARRSGEITARKLFEARGNNSEVHLSELELALVAATAAEVAIKGLRRGLSLKELET